MAGANRKRGGRARSKVVSGGEQNTLRLSQRELHRVLDAIEARHGHEESHPQRRFLRRSFRHSTLAARIRYEDRSVGPAFLVATKDVSRQGICLLHSSFMHKNVELIISLPNKSGGVVDMIGRVARCEHRGGIIHEIGVELAQPIDVTMVLDHDLFGDWFSLETVDPDQVVASLVLVGMTPDECSVITRLLAPAGGVTISTAGAPGDIAELDDSPAIIVVDADAPGAPLTELVDAARERLPRAYVAVSLSDPAPANLLKVRAAKPDAALIKPLSPEILMRMLAEFAIVRAPRTHSPGGAQAEHTTFDGKLANAVAPELQALGARLLKAADDEPARAIVPMLREIEGLLIPMDAEAIKSTVRGARSMVEGGALESDWREACRATAKLIQRANLGVTGRGGSHQAA